MDGIFFNKKIISFKFSHEYLGTYNNIMNNNKFKKINIKTPCSNFEEIFKIIDNSIFRRDYSKKKKLEFNFHNSLYNLDNKKKVKEKNESLFSIMKKEKIFFDEGVGKNSTKKGEKEEQKERKDYNNLIINEYGDQIFTHLLEKEKGNIYDYSNENLFEKQDKTIFNEKNRAIILNWLIKNNLRWGMKDDTIFTTINIMDRFVSKFSIEKEQYPLIAISAFFIATKYEDIYPLNIYKLSSVICNNFNKDDVLKKEYEILRGLDFEILYISSFNFLKFMYYLSEESNEKLFFIAQYILEITLGNLSVLSYPQSLRAISALLIAKKILKNEKSWNTLKLFFKYEENKIKKLKIDMAIALYNNTLEKNAIYEKFNSEKFKNVSDLVSNLLKDC